MGNNFTHSCYTVSLVNENWQNSEIMHKIFKLLTQISCLFFYDFGLWLLRVLHLHRSQDSRNKEEWSDGENV